MIIYSDKNIEIEDLLKKLEKLHHYLSYKNRNYCQKYLKQIIEELKNDQETENI